MQARHSHAQIARENGNFLFANEILLIAVRFEVIIS
jgi:hypothetical protein